MHNKHYIEFLKSWDSIYHEKLLSYEKKIEQIQTGIQNLEKICNFTTNFQQNIEKIDPKIAEIEQKKQEMNQKIDSQKQKTLEIYTKTETLKQEKQKQQDHLEHLQIELQDICQKSSLTYNNAYEQFSYLNHRDMNEFLGYLDKINQNKYAKKVLILAIFMLQNQVIDKNKLQENSFIKKFFVKMQG